MPKELFNQSQVDTLADSDRLAAGVPGQTGAKNILFSKFILQLKTFIQGLTESQATKLDSYPDFPETPAGLVLSDDGTFISVVTAAAGFVNSLYLSETASDKAGYKTLNYAIDEALTTVQNTVIAGDGDKLVASHLYPSGVNIAEYPGGTWSFNMFARILAVNGETRLGFRYFKYSTLDVKTYIFPAIVWSDPITNTTASLIATISTQMASAVDPTDRMGLDVYLKTTAGSTRTVEFTTGDGGASFLVTPNPMRHSLLRDKNGEEDFQHLTQTEKTNLLEHVNSALEWQYNSAAFVSDLTAGQFQFNADKTILYLSYVLNPNVGLSNTIQNYVEGIKSGSKFIFRDSTGKVLEAIATGDAVQGGSAANYATIACTVLNDSGIGNGLNCVVEIAGVGGGAGLAAATYSELLTLISTNSLIQGQKYILSDYQTKHVIPNSNPIEINIGTLEPLILIAANDHEFHVEVISTIYPSDIIHYRFDDDSCEDGTRDALNKKWTGGTVRPGYITYRKSTTNNLEVHNDWRNYKVRRWKLDCIAWVSAASYTKMDVAKGSNGNIYVAKTTHAGLTFDPAYDATNWQLAFDLSIQASGGFLSYTSVKTDFTVGEITPTNLIINNTTPGTDYQDYYQFCILSELTNSTGLLIADTFGTSGQGYNDYSIGRFDFDDFNSNYGNGSDLQSNIFYLIANGDNEMVYYSHVMGSESTYNTFIGITRFNTIGDGYISNTVGDDCSYNTVGDDCSYNTIGYRYISNTIGNNYDYNTIGNNYISNTIGDYYRSNTIGDGYISNTVGDRYISNTVGDDYRSNTIGNDYDSNTIGDGYQLNITTSPVQFTDFTSATHVYGDYNCTIFKNAAGVARLSYYDASDVLTIVNITA